MIMIFFMVTMSAFLAIGIACAVRIARRRPAADPYVRPIGDVPEVSLEQIIAISRRHRMTPEEQDQQRRSFVYANCKLANPLVTRAMVDRAAESAGLALRPDAAGGRSSIPSVRVAGRSFAHDEQSAEGRNV